MAEYFHAVTTDDKQVALDDAWESCQPAQEGGDTLPLLPQFRVFERSARVPLAGGMAIKASSTNSHSSMAFDGGINNVSPIEAVRIWRELTNLFQRCFRFITTPPSNVTEFKYTARNTLEEITVELPQASPTDTQVDGLMRNILVPITECQSDYSLLIVSGQAWMT